MPNTGLQLGLDSGQYCKRQHRWVFRIDDIVGDTRSNYALPPLKSARPNLAFKEMSVKHLIEDVYYPAKPDWKPITVTLYDLKKDINPIYDWIIKLYNPHPTVGTFVEPNRNKSPQLGNFIHTCILEMVDGCGEIVEQWVYEDCWPQSVNFQTLDYGQSGIVMCDLTLRYVRAYIN